MKATFDLPDDLLQELKLRALQEGRKLKHLTAEILHRGLAHPELPSRSIQHRVKLPQIQCLHPATPTKELAADEVSDVLLKQEVQWLDETARKAG